MPDQRAEAGGVCQRAEPTEAQHPPEERPVLSAAGGPRRPGRRRLPLHRHQGQHPGHQPQRARRPQSPPQQLRQDLPCGLRLPRLI